jgi:plasmid stability protein
VTGSIAQRVADAVTNGRPKEALELVAASRPPVDAGLALFVAEAWAAVGHERRGAALLLLAARRSPGDRALALEAARALLRRGHHRQASRLLAPHAVSAPVLVAVAARQPSGALRVVDVQDEIDHALATPTTTAALTSLLERAPGSVRLRVAVAARTLDEGHGAEARAILRAGLMGREDARLELALATVAVASGTWDEAAVVIARARSRFPHLARDPALQALLALVTVSAGRRDDAISLLHGTQGAHITAALHALLAAAAPTRPGAAPPPATASRPMSALMQETLARAGAGPSSGNVGGGSPVAAQPSVSTSPPTPPSTLAPPAQPSTAQAASPAASPLTARPPPPTATPRVTAPPTPSPPTPSPPTPSPPTPSPPTPSPPTPSFRRIDAQPEPKGNRTPLVVVATLLVMAFVGPRLWRTTPPAPARAAVTAFAEKLGRCGLEVEPWLDVDVSPSSLAAAAGSGWRGRPASVPSEGLPLDAALQPGVTLLPMRTGAAIEPALVATPSLDRVLGLAFTTSAERPLVSSLFGALKFDRATSRTCPEGTCAVGHARCEDLAIRVQAICPGPTTASLLSRCTLDAAVIGPETLLPTPTAPAPPTPPVSSLSGTDVVVPLSEP